MIPLIKTLMPPRELLLPRLEEVLYSGYVAQGEQVDLDCNISSRLWKEDKYFTSISVWRKNQVQQLAPATPITAKHVETIVQNDTDLPF